MALSIRPMTFGILTETKPLETRVGLTPVEVGRLTGMGHQVVLAPGAGSKSFFTDADYVGAGARLVIDPGDVLDLADVVVGVKEPQEWMFDRFREGQLFCGFLHLGGDPALLARLQARRMSAVAYELIRTDSGEIPVLAPMSEIAGALAIYMGQQALLTSAGGKGVSLTPIGGQPGGTVTVIGCGNVGKRAAALAYFNGADVTVVDINPVRLAELHALQLAEVTRPGWGPGVPTLSHHGRLRTLYNDGSKADELREIIAATDLLIGAVLVPGRPAPKVVTQDMVMRMGAGSVIVDVAIDEGGCVETSAHRQPGENQFQWRGVTHIVRPNMPAEWGRTASIALANAFWPYLERIATTGLRDTAAPEHFEDPVLRSLRRGTVLLLGNDIQAD